MVSKKNWVRMLVIVLVFGMMLIGIIFPARVSADDLWANVPNLALLNGIWKGTYSQSETLIEATERGMQRQAEAVSSEIQNSIRNQHDQLIKQVQDMFGDMQYAIKGELTITINASTSTISVSGTNTMTYSGGNINTIWPAMKTGLQNKDGITFSSNDAEHSITSKYYFLDSFENKGIQFQVNQSGTKLKIISLIIGEGVIGTDFYGIIIPKQ